MKNNPICPALNLMGVAIFFLLASCGTADHGKLIESMEINENWEFSEYLSEQWHGAEVPGCVHTDLMKNGVIEDPFYRLNEHKVQWIDKKDWVYRTRFEVKASLLHKDRVILEFAGLDTHAEVKLNGEQILETDNMFRTWTVDVKAFLREGSNDMEILFHSPIKVGVDIYDNYPHRVEAGDNDLAAIGQVEGGKKVSVHLRKAPYHFGWDWGPRLVSSGIWKPITLKAWNGARMKDLQVVQEQLSDASASLTARFEIEAEHAGNARLMVRVNDEEVKAVKVSLKEGVHGYELPFTIENPRRWWTNSLGEAYLYKVSATLKTGQGSQELSHRIGLRTLEVIREKDSDGTSLYFKLNGHPVFMKGANYIPNDPFLNRVSPETYKAVIGTAKESHFNMLRVWGGGIYEKDIFYDLCDENGILVWQDFMFACNMYPGHPEFLESVAHEASDNIRRLRNHPCIALWCGNNEILAAWWNWGWKERIEKEDPEAARAQWKAYKDIFLVTLPVAVKAHDPQRFYWASSPQSGDTIPADLSNGDEHYWGVWWGKESFETYHTHLARFMSEYGFQSFPEMKTVKQYAVEEDFDIYSDVMKSHQRSSIGNETIETYMLRDFKAPKDFASYLYMGQVLQAEGVKKAMEGHRIAMPYTMGTLYWQINDCWPVASWSSTDYFLRWKALQYYAKRAFAPVLVAPRVENGELMVHVVSDRLESFDALLSLKLVNFEGKILWEKELRPEIEANTSQLCFQAQRKEVLAGYSDREVVLLAELREGDEVLSSNTVYFSKAKDMDLPLPKVKINATACDSGYELVLNTDVLAMKLCLELEGEGRFSDNYFDLIPGQQKKILLQTREDGNILDKISSRTVAGSY